MPEQSKDIDINDVFAIVDDDQRFILETMMLNGSNIQLSAQNLGIDVSELRGILDDIRELMVD